MFILAAGKRPAGNNGQDSRGARGLQLMVCCWAWVRGPSNRAKLLQNSTADIEGMLILDADDDVYWH